jgi:hypothetical protein
VVGVSHAALADTFSICVAARAAANESKLDNSYPSILPFYNACFTRIWAAILYVSCISLYSFSFATSFLSVSFRIAIFPTQIFITSLLHTSRLALVD